MRTIPFASFALAGVALHSAAADVHDTDHDDAPPASHAQLEDAARPGDPQLGSTSYSQGQVLALLELAAPSQPTMMLRGTVPLPPGLFPTADGTVPFAVRDPRGVETPAQVEVVSRFARDADGADVVEVLSSVAVPPEAQPGDRLQYAVIWSPHQPRAIDLHPSVAALIGSSTGVTLRARDVFGHEYRADLLHDLRVHDPELRHLRDGAVAQQVRTHETMMPVHPVHGALGTLPHGLGVHSFLTMWDDAQVLSLDLRVHNGADGLDPGDPTDDPLGAVYFRELELTLPAGWVAVGALEDPLQGAPYPVHANRNAWPLVQSNADGTLHVMGAQGQLHRRLVIARAGHVDLARELVGESWLGFCVRAQDADHQELFSWWNPRTAAYFPQKQVLPDLWHIDPADQRAQLADEYSLYRGVLRTGAGGPWPVTVPALGWAHPWGVDSGYASGGEEIHLYDGVRTVWSASRDGYRIFQLVHRMMTERHPTALFDGDGDAFALEDWIVQGPSGPYLPVYIWTVPLLWIADPFGFGASPSFQRDAVAAQGLAPHYEATLLGFQPIDRAHKVRYTRSAKVLAWLGNDALAKDDLRLQAELARAGYQMLPQNHNGDHIVTGMLADALAAQANPNQGLAMNRGEGWAIDTMAAAFCLAEPPWRANTRPWFHDLAAVVAAGISDCTGIIIEDPTLNHLGGIYRARQSISAAILQHALWGVREAAFGGHDPQAHAALSADLLRDLYGGISSLVWNEAEHAPWFYVALGPYDLGEPEFCGHWPSDGFDQTDSYQVWCSFAYGWRLSGDPAFLARATETLGEPLGTPALEDGHYGTVENRAALMALVQELFE